MNKLVAVFLIGTLVMLTAVLPWPASAAPRGSGALTGHIFNEDMRTPVRNAVVKLRNITTQKEYESEPTDVDGLYRIPGLEEGRYIMGVLGPSGNYNFHYSIMIKADALAKLSVAMKAGNAPVMVQQGTSDNRKKTTIIDFFKSPAGILTLVSAAEMTLFLVALKEGEASPIID
jgi:hypothetical protein